MTTAINSTFVRKNPALVESAYATEYIQQSVQAIRSEPINFDSTSPATAFEVPANTLVEGVIVEVVTAFNGVIPSMSVGVSGAASRHVVASDVDLAAVGSIKVSRPYNYSADAKILVTLTPGGSTTGKMYVWLLYRSNSDQAS